MRVTGPEFVLVAGTRVMLGVGIGLLAAGRITDENRRLIGRILFAIGAVSTIPLAWQVLGRQARGVRTFENKTSPTDGELAM